MKPSGLALLAHLLIPASLPWSAQIPLWLTAVTLVFFREAMARFPKSCIFFSFSLLALRAALAETGFTATLWVFLDSFTLWLILSWESTSGEFKTFLKDLLRNSTRLALVIGLLGSLFLSVLPSSPFRSLLAASPVAKIGLGSGQEIFPGQNAVLNDSEKTAFVVKTGREIPRDQLYWRAHTLTATLDGMHWFNRKAVRNLSAGKDREVSQKVILFAHPSEVPIGLDPPSRIEVITENLMLARSTLPVPDLPPPEAKERRPLRINDPELLALIRKLNPDSSQDPEVIRERILEWFGREFRYTLEPGILAPPRLSRFLLQTKAGYCEHFAASFSSLMRAQGLPSRVVIGYHGGTWNPLNESYHVSERDAHAWSEFWSDSKGRWIRVDPTRAVPGGIAALNPQDPGQFRLWFEAMVSEWRLFLEENPGSALALGLFVFFLTGSLLFTLLRRKSPPEEQLLEVYRKWCRKSAQSGIVRSATEGPRDFGERLVSAFPDQASSIREFTDAFIQFRYGNHPFGNKALRRMRRLLRQSSFQALKGPVTEVHGIST